MKRELKYLIFPVLLLFFLFPGCGGGDGSGVTPQVTPAPQPDNNVPASGSGIYLEIHWPGTGVKSSGTLEGSLIQPSVSYIKLNLYKLDGTDIPADWVDNIVQRPTDPNGVSKFFFPAPAGSRVIVRAAGFPRWRSFIPSSEDSGCLSRQSDHSFTCAWNKHL